MSQDQQIEKNHSSIESFQDCVIAEYRSLEKADLALEVLATGGFTTENVSRISLNPDTSPAPETTRHQSASQSQCTPRASGPNDETTTDRTGQQPAPAGSSLAGSTVEGKIPDQVRGNPDEQKANRAAGVGAVIGGALATPVAVGSLVGPFFVVGPLLGLGLGAAVGGLFGAAERWGVRRDVAADYEKKVREGSVLVVVTDSSLRLHEAYKLLQTSGPYSLERFRVPA